MEDYYEYLDSNGVTTLYKLIKDDTVALIDSYSVTINGITTTLDTHINDSDIHTPISDIESMVDTKISGLVNSAPETLDTLKELSDALGNDTNFATTVANQIGNKANKDSVYTREETDTLLEGKANSVHNHVVSDITDFPTIPTKLSQLENDMGFGSGSGGAITSISWTNITDKPNFATVATSGSYNDLSNKPTIPKVYNKTLTIQKNGTNVATFTSNSNTDVTANITVPTKTSDLTNDSGFITGISWDKVTNKPTLAKVATSGSYTDLSNTPTIPTKVSQLENDMGFGTGGDTSDCVHKTGNETIDGIKKFTADISRKYTAVDITTTPTSDMYAHINFTDKNDKSVAYIQYAQKSNGVDYIGLRVRDKNSTTWGVQLNTNKEFIPLGNNSYSLGSSSSKWAKIYSDDVVHTSGNETINGNKTFNNSLTFCGNVNKKNNYVDRSVKPTSDTSSNFVFLDKNSSVLGYLNHTHKTDGVNHIGLYVKDSNNSDHGFRVTVNNVVLPLSNNTYSLGTSSYKWKNVYATTFNGNLKGNADTATSANDPNAVHRSGDEFIDGIKSFNNHICAYDNMSNKNMQMDLFTTPANNLFAHYLFMDKNNEVCAYMQYGQINYGTDFIGLFVKDKSENLIGVELNTNNEVIPLSNNTYNLGSPTNKWKNVYATTFNGNLKGNADTATYATTQAIFDNSTKIATTAWVRNYVNSVAGNHTVVNSVAGSGSRSASISAYYSNATTLTAEGSPSSSDGSYPSDYSDYINISPTVGTIYTGSQLFGTLNASASGSKYSHSPSGQTVYQTTAKATAKFSGAFSSSAKYLCTTANAVKFRAFVSQGTTSDIGTASVIENSSTKSIFTRIE